MKAPRKLILVVAALACLPCALFAQTITRRVGNVTILADHHLAAPGGVLIVRLQSRVGLGAVNAILDGYRVPFFPTPRGLRALVPVPLGTPPGPRTLGLEIFARTGRQRVAVEVPVGERVFAARTQVVPEEKRPLLKRPEAVRDGRRLLLVLRTVTPTAQFTGSFHPPVTIGAVPSFGAAETYVGGSPVEQMMDSTYGEYHRGLDYPVPAGTPVLAPAAGTVLMAEPLALTGQTLVIDHGQGIVSAFYHLSRLDVREGDKVEAHAPLALSGETGLAITPHLHWGVYLHGIAVDPVLLERMADW